LVTGGACAWRRRIAVESFCQNTGDDEVTVAIIDGLNIGANVLAAIPDFADRHPQM
jgi:hypothetical protein